MTATFSGSAENSMSDFAPITLRAIDNNNTQLFQYSVPFQLKISAREVLEHAFILAQTSPNPDPFIYTLQYFGYSESPQFPGYLGYEIESIGSLSNNSQFFWDLLVDGVSSSSGADTTYPNPGATVLWQYTPIPVGPAALSKRATVIQSRRAGRS
jgi:hypothetical protein